MNTTEEDLFAGLIVAVTTSLTEIKLSDIREVALVPPHGFDITFRSYAAKKTFQSAVSDGKIVISYRGQPYLGTLVDQLDSTPSNSEGKTSSFNYLPIIIAASVGGGLLLFALVGLAISKARGSRSHVRPLDIRYDKNWILSRVTIHPLDRAMATFGQSTDTIYSVGSIEA